ncbi:MAG: cytochrome P450 [Caulobacterales bacterium]
MLPPKPNEALSREFFKPENIACPFETWRKLRQECPVPYMQAPGGGSGAFLITRKEDVEYVSQHPEIFTSEVTADVWRWGNDLPPELMKIIDEQGGYKIVHTIVTSDPPRSALYRRIAIEALSVGKVNARAGAIQSIIDELIANIPDDTPIDFREKFAVPLPLRVILDLFGLPREDSQFVYDCTCAIIHMVDPITPIDEAKPSLMQVIAGQKYLAQRIEKYRETPEDNFLSYVANARNNDGALLSMEEAISVAFITMIGGNETTRNALSSMAYELARDPNMWRRLQADESLIPVFIEEAVRQGSPATLTPRQVAQDTELNGTPMPKGAPVYVLWASGSHDERYFEDANTIRLDRTNGRQHTSFGFGVHHCAGVHLARKELEMSLRAWLKAFESMEFAVPQEDVLFAPSFGVRQLYALPLRLKRK